MRSRNNKTTPLVVDALASDLASSAKIRGELRSVPSPLDDRMAFVRGFFANPGQVGSVVPSSRHLEDRLVRAAGVASARTVVELGPGTGGTTRALLRVMSPDARLLAIELSSYFHRRLVEQLSDSRLALQLGSAEQLADLLDSWCLPAPDAVLSGIPFSTMPVDVAERVAATVASCLAPGGRFVAYQICANVAQFITPHLGTPEIAWEWRNIPPLRVFTWTRPAVEPAR